MPRRFQATINAVTAQRAGLVRRVPLVVGLLMVVVAAIGASACISGIGKVPVKVRPATVDEAPDKTVAQETVVGEPDGSPSVLPALQRVFVWLLALAVIAAVGAGLATWALLAPADKPPAGDADE